MKIVVGRVTGVDATTGDILAVRDSGNRSYTRVQSCVAANVGSMVVMVRASESMQWIVVGEVRDGYSGGQRTLQADLTAPAEMAVFSLPRMNVVQWETYPGDNTLSYEVNYAPDDGSGDPDTGDVTEALVTRGSYYIHEGIEYDDVWHYRVRAMRWIGPNNIVYSGWTPWQSILGEVEEHDLLGVMHNHTVPDEEPTPGLMIVGNESNDWQSMDLGQDAVIDDSANVTVQGLQGRPLGSGAPSEGDVYMYGGDSSDWHPEYIVHFGDDAPSDPLPGQMWVDTGDYSIGSLRPSVRSVTDTTTMTGSDDILLCTGTFTVNLPSAANYPNKVYYIVNVSSGVITVDAYGSETINGETTQDLYENDSMQIVSDGTGWVII
jgi:hypothetical protein